MIGSGVFGPIGDPCTIPHGWTLEFQVVIDNVKSDLFTFTSSDDTWNAEYKIHMCIYKDYGGPEYICEAGTKIEICKKKKSGSSSSSTQRYIDKGTATGIEEQEKDFITDRSSLDGNCTNVQRG